MGVVANAAEGAGRDTERAQRGAAEPRERPHTAESSGAERGDGTGQREGRREGAERAQGR